MVVSISESVLVLSVLLICLPRCSYSHQEVIHAAAENHSINHGCPSWFIPINNSSDRCKCGEPIHRPGRVVLCDPNTNQTLVRITYCMDYNKDKNEVFIGECYFNKKGKVQEIYVKFPQNVSELNPFLCSGLNRTGVMCSQCQKGLGTAIFSYSMPCLPCMSSGLGWTLYVFLATFPTTILFLFVLIFQCRCITSGPMNFYVFVCQLIVSTLNNQPSIVNLFANGSFSFILRVLITVYGIWNLDFFRYLIPPFCVSDQISPLHVITLEYVVAFYPLLLTIIVYICIQLHARGYQAIVCLCRVFCKCFSSCRQKWGRQWDPFASLIHTFAAFLLLSYSKILIISLQLLSYTQLHLPTGETISPPMRVLHDPSLEWFGEKNLPFALFAIFILCLFVFMPALFLLLYPMKIFQKCLGCCGRRLLGLHAFADVFQGCYKNGTNGTRDCRYFAGIYLVLRIVLLPALYSIYGFYDEMVLIVCLVTASLLFLLFCPYKDSSWLNVWDSIAFSLYAFVVFCVLYSKFVASSDM